MALKLAVFIAAALGLPALPCAAQEMADFYKGKQIAIVVGFTPGGSSSLYAQALARHMGRYLPGSPNLIVQHVPGAGGLVAANNVYNTAPRDGTTFANTGRTVAIEPLLGNKNAKFDARQFNWIGTANVEYTTCALWHTAKVKTLQDALSIEAVVGGSGEILLAMERGEVEGFCGIGWTFLKLRKGDWLKDKKINILYQMSLEKHPELPDVPAIIDHAKTPEDRKVFEFLFAPQEMGRPFFAPPGVPAERVRALRDAFARTLQDPQFLADADKMGIEVQHVGGEQIQMLVERIYASPPEVITRARAVAE